EFRRVLFRSNEILSNPSRNLCNNSGTTFSNRWRLSLSIGTVKLHTNNWAVLTVDNHSSLVVPCLRQVMNITLAQASRNNLVALAGSVWSSITAVNAASTSARARSDLVLPSSASIVRCSRICARSEEHTSELQ